MCVSFYDCFFVICVLLVVFMCVVYVGDDHGVVLRVVLSGYSYFKHKQC